MPASRLSRAPRGAARRVVLTALVAILVSGLGQTGPRSSAVSLALQPPVLKWQRGGCYSSWCETGWYSSPAVADLEGDGVADVIAAMYSTVVLDGRDGSLKKRIDPPVAGGRAWPGVVVTDVNADGRLEIVTAHGSGYVRLLDRAGDVVWTRRPAGGELRGLSAYDLDRDGQLEIVVTGALASQENTWVFEPDGTLRSGWPQLSDESGYAAGVYNANAAVGDLNGDGWGELVVPSDVHYICAYDRNGNQLAANPMYGGKGWGKVGVWESAATELKGWGDCDTSRAERYRANLAHGASVIADMDGDATAEVVVVGNVYDCAVGHPPGKYNGVYVLNADRSRFNAGGMDWRNPPVDTGAPLTEDYDVIENNQPNPVVADLDGDGNREIIYPSYDGRVHAFWLDKTEHYDWPFSVYTGGIYRFASEPVVADLDNDGRAEVIFASWAEKASGQTGKLHVVNYMGRMLHEVDLPPALSADWNGALAAPTLADIDGDGELEAVLNTAHSGVVAYDLPGTANARVLWGTGRGNYQRSGSIMQGTLQGSVKSAAPVRPGPGDTVAYTILLQNPGPLLAGVRVTDTLPTQVSFAGGLWASAGSYGQAGGTITWTGSVAGGVPVTITFNATVSAAITQPRAILNTAFVDDGQGTIWRRQAFIIANGLAVHLPLVMR